LAGFSFYKLMMQKFLIVVFLFSSFIAVSQNQNEEVSQQPLSKEQKQIVLLKELGKKMIQEENFEQRRTANYAFIKQLTRLLKTKNSYNISLEELTFMSVQKPEDDAFRIFTWQVETAPGLARHYGAIQINQKDLKLIPLTDISDDMETPELHIGNSREWFGAIYYRVQSVKRKKNTQYFLYGYDSNNPASNKKIVDVVQFNGDDVVFGLPVFPDIIRPGQLANRFIIEYREDAGVRLNYSPSEKKIVFDHLVPINEASEGIFANYVPDGTFDALVMKEGKFAYETNVVATSSEQLETETRPDRSDKIYDSKAKE